MAVILGEMDAARAKPKLWPECKPSVRENIWDASLQPTVAANYPGGGGEGRDTRSAIYPVEDVLQARIS